MKSKIINNQYVSLVHPAPNPNVRNAAKALYEAGLLQSVISTVVYSPEGWLSRGLRIMPRRLKFSIAQQLSRRAWFLPKEVSIIAHPLNEILRIIFFY